jgi:16S rRNA (guanine(966)-N(2))-methyltransferase RsmD
VRESLFASLDAKSVLKGSRVLDLFAGSGALGLEALSRGAVFAQFVDASTDAVSAIRANVSAFQLGAGEVSVLKCDILKEATIRHLETPKQFDIIFLDPPYAITDASIQALLDNIHKYNLLAPDGTVILESESARCLDNTHFDCVNVKKYGGTVLQFFTQF